MTNNAPFPFSLPFLRKEQVAKDAHAFSFDLSSVPFSFLPGQYIRMTLPHENADERGTSRFFSIACSPLKTNTLRIITRIIKSTFKKTLFNLSEGTPVQFFGPLGRFVLLENETMPHVFLSGGIGITPFLSMVPYAAEKKLSIPITLFASFSTTEEMVGLEEVTNAERENPAIKIVYTITRPQESEKPWNGETGRISEEMIKKYIQKSLDCLFYIVGPPAMAEAMNQIVTSLGVLKDQIRRENFTGY
ncbi:MAG: FAD-dependent oxidoreductase [Candidatus Levybacteria bacterium]|nr:FAD-dependent oxidoreductase [Candidatus Levybacteria bacterium]